MSGVVGIIANDSARYTMFTFSLVNLQGPPNTTMEWGLGSDRIRGRNNLVRRAQEIGAEWLFFLDDDVIFRHDLLNRLLAHEVDVCASLYLGRMKPFHPIVYSHEEDGRYFPITMADYGEDELIEVHAAGTGGMLIRMEVFRAIEAAFPDQPIFEHGVASEDLIFCEKAHEVGFPVFCDLGARLGHLTATAIWPTYVDGEWLAGFQVADNFSLVAPIQYEEAVV